MSATGLEVFDETLKTILIQDGEPSADISRDRPGDRGAAAT